MSRTWGPTTTPLSNSPTTTGSRTRRDNGGMPKISTMPRANFASGGRARACERMYSRSPKVDALRLAGLVVDQQDLGNLDEHGLAVLKEEPHCTSSHLTLESVTHGHEHPSAPYWEPAWRRSASTRLCTSRSPGVRVRSCSA